MNIFVLDLDIDLCAEYHCNAHCVKMILEHVQLLSTACHLHPNRRRDNPQDIYRSTHVNHPCAKWVRESVANWRYLRDLTFALDAERRFRWSHNNEHKSVAIMRRLPVPDLPDLGLTPFAQAMPGPYRRPDAVESYRLYYLYSKSHLWSWGRRGPPKWLTASLRELISNEG
jgi:hypothetical protein